MCDLVVSHLVSSSSLVLSPAISPTSGFPLLTNSRLSHPGASHAVLSWSGKGQGERTHGMGSVSSSKYLLVCPVLLNLCHISYEPLFCNSFTERRHQDQKKDLGTDGWEREIWKVDLLQMAQLCIALQLLCWLFGRLVCRAQTGFYMVSQSPCEWFWCVSAYQITDLAWDTCQHADRNEFWLMTILWLIFAPSHLGMRTNVLVFEVTWSA